MVPCTMNTWSIYSVLFTLKVRARRERDGRGKIDPSMTRGCREILHLNAIVVFVLLRGLLLERRLLSKSHDDDPTLPNPGKRTLVLIRSRSVSYFVMIGVMSVLSGLWISFIASRVSLRYLNELPAPRCIGELSNSPERLDTYHD